MTMQKNAIHYHDANGKYLHVYRHASARRIATTMADRITVTLVANDGSATTGQIMGMMLEDGSGHKFIVNMLNKHTGKTEKKFVVDPSPKS